MSRKAFGFGRDYSAGEWKLVPVAAFCVVFALHSYVTNRSR